MRLTRLPNPRWRLLVALFCLVLVSGPRHAEETASVAVELEWGSVAGAWGYVVQIRSIPDGKEVTTLRTADTRVTVELQPGSYERRVASVNKFRRPSAWSPWAPLVVRLTQDPMIDELTPERVTAENFGIYNIRVRGSHFLSGIRASLRRDGKELSIVEIRRVDAENLELVVNAQGALPGPYELELVNPGNASATRPEALTLSNDVPVAKKEATEPAKEVAAMVDFGARSESPSSKEVAVLVPKKETEPTRRALEPKSEKKAEPFTDVKSNKEPTRRAAAEIPIWQTLIPGLPQLMRGDTGRAGIYWGTMGAFAVGGAAAWYAAEARAASESRNVMYRLFNDPLTYMSMRSTLNTGSTGLALYFMTQQSFSKSQASYYGAQRLAAGAAFGMLVVYAVHLFDARRSVEPPTGVTGGANADFAFELGYEPPRANEKPGATVGLRLRF